ncbi:LysR family transcriptional regulator [Pseudomonas entomophila]|uniref:LysR family transcriptional regulator n=1 Tax=Pseudomonas entomophila TaxID=312306 RepID=UPI001C6119DA|nr:LysR family transcriptional regulator [Pseudomonas entomophila]
MNTPLNWNDLRYFAAVMRHGGLSGAARHLNVGIQTVGRRIGALESALGTSLFVRHASGYLPTDDAQRLMSETEGVEAAIARFTAHGTPGETVSGTVRLAAPQTLLDHILMPALQPLLRQYPALQLECLTGVTPIGIARGEADLALRLVKPEQGALTRQRVGTQAYGLYAAPGLNTDLSRVRLVGWAGELQLPARGWLETLTGRQPDLRTTHLHSQRAAISAGLGVGILPCFLAQGLQRLPTPMPLQETLWLVGHADSAVARVRRVREEIVAILAQAAGLLEGQELASPSSLGVDNA